MYVPELYAMALFLMIYSMLCWGSWINIHRLCKRWRFELFYWDYVWGILLSSLLIGVTLGRTDPTSADSFFRNLGAASTGCLAYAVTSGIIWNLANILIVAAMYVAGMAVAFPIGIGLGLVIGSVLNYILKPVGNPLLLFGGIGLVCVAVGLVGAAYRKHVRDLVISTKGIVLSVAGGIFMGLFYPLIVKATTGEGHLGPYTVAFVFAVGAVLGNFPFNYALMRWPVMGERIQMSDYFAGRGIAHFWGVVSGLAWQAGTTANFAAAYANLVGPAASYAIGLGSGIVGTSWGVFVWREFRGAGSAVVRYLALMFVFFILGLVCIALAPVVR